MRGQGVLVGAEEEVDDKESESLILSLNPHIHYFFTLRPQACFVKRQPSRVTIST